MYFLNKEWAYLCSRGKSGFVSTYKFGRPCAIGFEKIDGTIIVDLEEAFATKEELAPVIFYFSDYQFFPTVVKSGEFDSIKFSQTWERVLDQIETELDGHIMSEHDFILPNNCRLLRNFMCSMENIGLNLEHLYVTNYLQKSFIVLGKILDRDSKGNVDEEIWYGKDYGQSGYGYFLYPDVDNLISACDENQQIALYYITSPAELIGDNYHEKVCGGYYRIYDYCSEKAVTHIMTDDAPSIQMFLNNNCELLTKYLTDIREVLPD